MRNKKELQSATYKIEKSLKSDFSLVSLDKTHFSRFKFRFPDTYLENCFAYVFITKPDINILNGNELTIPAQNIPSIVQAYNEYEDIIHYLQKNSNIKNNFIYPITNYAESFSPQDSVLKTSDVGETFSGYQITYAEHHTESETSGDFSIKFTDDRDLTLYKLFKLWVNYMSLVKKNYLQAKKKYRQGFILDYASSLYYFVVAEDGATILYYAKYTGVFPTSIPDSTFSFNQGSNMQLEYNIPFKYSFKEQFDYRILREFNSVSRYNTFWTAPSYEYDDKEKAKWLNGNLIKAKTSQNGYNWCKGAYVDTVKQKDGSVKYKLRFSYL